MASLHQEIKMLIRVSALFLLPLLAMATARPIIKQPGNKNGWYDLFVWTGDSTDAGTKFANAIPYPPQSLWGDKERGSIHNDDGINDRVAAVTLTVDTALNTMAFTYQGSSEPSKAFGTVEGPHKYHIIFAANETLVGISGYTGIVESKIRVASVKFYTNVQTYGPFGQEDVEEAQSFECHPPAGCEIAGFYGRTGDCVNSLGLYVRLTMQACDAEEASSMQSAVTLAMKNAAKILKCGDWTPVPSLSWGGLGAYPWDEGLFKGIRQIKLRYDDSYINTIQSQYVGIEGDTVQGNMQGNEEAKKNVTIDLNYPEEYLMSVSGTVGRGGSFPKVVKSLKFISNLKVYGPYGDVSGEAFSSPECGCKIIGFHGRSGGALDNFGVHLLTHEPSSDENSGWEEFAAAKIIARLLNMKE